MTQRKCASFCFTLYKIIDYLLWKRVLSCVLVYVVEVQCNIRYYYPAV